MKSDSGVGLTLIQLRILRNGEDAEVSLEGFAVVDEFKRSDLAMSIKLSKGFGYLPTWVASTCLGKFVDSDSTLSSYYGKHLSRRRKVGKAISMRDREWTYIYRLYEPDELYSRVNDPSELHNLAAEPEHQSRVQNMKADMFKWMVEGSDFLPFHKDARFPEVNLKSPAEQFAERKKRKEVSEQ